VQLAQSLQKSPNYPVERTAGSHRVAAAAHRSVEFMHNDDKDHPTRWPAGERLTDARDAHRQPSQLQKAVLDASNSYSNAPAPTEFTGRDIVAEIEATDSSSERRTSRSPPLAGHVLAALVTRPSRPPQRRLQVKHDAPATDSRPSDVSPFLQSISRMDRDIFPVHGPTETVSGTVTAVRTLRRQARARGRCHLAKIACTHPAINELSTSRAYNTVLRSIQVCRRPFLRTSSRVAA
jgi:hypothetical protein